MATYALTIEGVSRTLQGRWEIRETASGVSTMRFAVVSQDGSYTPAFDDEMIFTEDGTRIFAGFIKTAKTRGVNNVGRTPILTEVTASSYATLTKRRSYNSTLAAGTLKSMLQTLVTVLDNVTLDAAQVDGPTLEAQTINAWRVEDILTELGRLAGGWVWEIDYQRVLRMYEPSTVAAPFNITAGDGNVIGDVAVEPTRNEYANYVTVYGTGVTAVASDAGEMASYGPWDLVVTSPDTTSQDAVDALALAILAERLVATRVVEYVTHETGIVPGMTQTITLPTRGLTGSYLVREVITSPVNQRLAQRKVSAIGGTAYRTGWQKKVADWMTRSGALSLPGVSAVASFQRPTYEVGSDGGLFVESPTPTWVAASPRVVTINTVQRGTVSATVRVQLRAVNAGISVQARLWDIDAGASCGTSAVVTSTSWTDASFSVTLNAVTHQYRLELLPGAADEQVGGVGYVE